MVECLVKPSGGLNRHERAQIAAELEPPSRPQRAGKRRRGGAASRLTEGRPLIAVQPSLPGRKVIALDVDDPAFVERNLQQFIDGLVVAEAVEREGKQPLVYVEAH
jgi:hypothetical protein